MAMITTGAIDSNRLDGQFDFRRNLGLSTLADSQLVT